MTQSAEVPQPDIVGWLGPWHFLASWIDFRCPAATQQTAAAMAFARQLDVSPAAALVAFGVLDETEVIHAIGAALAIPVAQPAVVPALAVDVAPDRPHGLPSVARAMVAGDQVVIVAALDLDWHDLQRLVGGSGWPPARMLLVTRHQMARAVAAVRPDILLSHATSHLAHARPELSASEPPRAWQSLTAVVLAGLLLGAALAGPQLALALLGLLTTLPFVCVVVLRLAALREALRAPRIVDIEREPVTRVPDHELPTYTILVPLYREANVLPGLVDALAGLDYPADRLEALLILEADDVETHAAAAILDLPSFMRVVTVPAGAPRTKPKALDFALPQARGRYVVIYDAEDIPEPDQLRRAIAAFRSGGPDLACVQGRLNIDNAEVGFLTRQFAIEYTALFDAFLPALARSALPIPLGGTSNHFPTALLRALGGWDPYNVTEDADLGLRIARAGLDIAVLPSTTWEEAPATWGNWLRQRTRWLKGWMLTYLVHMRDPPRLLADLGRWQFAGFQVLMMGMVMAPLLHPLAYPLLALALTTGGLAPSSAAGTAVLAVAAVNLILGFAGAMALGTVTVWQRGHRRLAIHTLLMPLYWLAISLASYRALWQLVRDPHLWEKTEHGQSPRRRG